MANDILTTTKAAQLLDISVRTAPNCAFIGTGHPACLADARAERLSLLLYLAAHPALGQTWLMAVNDADATATEANRALPSPGNLSQASSLWSFAMP